MKKFISAITAIAMTAGVMASMTVVANAEEPTFPEAGNNVQTVSSAEDFTEKWGDSTVTGIQLGGDITLDTMMTVQNHEIYLDLNGYTLTSTAGNAIETKNSFTITNTQTEGGFKHTGNSIALKISGGNIKIENVKFEATVNNAAISLNAAKSNVMIKNANIINNGAGNSCTAVAVADGTLKFEGDATKVMGERNALKVNAPKTNQAVTIENGEFSISSNYSDSHCIANGGTGELIINSGIFKVSDNPTGKECVLYQSGNGKLTVNGGTFTNTKGNVLSHWISGNKGAIGAIVTLNGGNFTGSLPKQADVTDKYTINITGGTYTVDPSDYVYAAQYDVKEDPQGTWTVSKKGGEVEPPAPPTETKYYAVDLGDNAGSYTKVSVTANNGGKDATVEKELGSTFTLDGDAGVSLGIEITDIPTGEAGTFTITSVTLE